MDGVRCLRQSHVRRQLLARRDCRSGEEFLMAASDLEVVPCRECGAKRQVGDQEYCWLCYARLESPSHDVLLRPATAQQQAGNTFGLSTLMIVVVLCPVLFGVFRESLGFGILLAIVVTPVLVATVARSLKRQASGRPMTGWQHVDTLAATAGVVVGSIAAGVVGIVLIFVAAWAAFWDICSSLMGDKNPPIPPLAILVLHFALGILAALVVARRLWPRKD